MDKKSVILIFFLFFVIVALAGCTSKPVTETVPADNSATQTGEMDVQSLILEKVGSCHSVDRIYGASKTREEWNATLDRMIGYGAKISDAEKEIIIDYLLAQK